jgi:CTP:molybdopterin cytidylyltransferase MocA
MHGRLIAAHVISPVPEPSLRVLFTRPIIAGRVLLRSLHQLECDESLRSLLESLGTRS